MSIAVVVVTYDDPHRLELCLEGLARQTTPKFALYVVDDGSPEPAMLANRKLAVKHTAQWRYLGPENDEFRAGQARNLALASIRADRTLFVDGDCVLAPDVVATHEDYQGTPVVVCGARKHVQESQVLHLNKHDLYDGLDAHVVDRDQRYRQRGGPYTAFRRSLASGQENLPLGSYRLAWGFQMSVPTELTKEIGGFNESFVGYGGEDQELAARLQQRGCHLVGRMDLIAYHLDHPRRSGDWMSRVSESVAQPNPVRNERSSYGETTRPHSDSRDRHEAGR